MIHGTYELNLRAFEPDHIQEVLDDLKDVFLHYYQQMDTIRSPAMRRFATDIGEFRKEREKYVDFLETERLEEFDYDPNSFKGSMRSDCPIVRRCLNSPAKVMDSYRSAFNGTSGAKMLEVTTNIVTFAHEYMQYFRDEYHFRAISLEDLGLAPLDSETYTAYGVIGGGIRSHFLYQLYPRAFPNRSQAAIWALYFMTNRKDYGFVDGSEFLMIQEEGAQQNYFYPYELFAFYAQQLFLMIHDAVGSSGRNLDPAYRYVYVDTFLRFVAEIHENDINIIRPQSQRFDY